MSEQTNIAKNSYITDLLDNHELDYHIDSDNIVSITSPVAWQILSLDKVNAHLIDVRTNPEWVFTGIPNLQPIGQELIDISWRLFPTMEVNSDFPSQLQNRVPNRDDILLFICRSGGRSKESARFSTELFEYKHVVNVIDGFEGDPDINGQRNNIAGWKFHKLPWLQN